MQKRFFPFLIALSALAVSGSAAFYSVYGLSKLFAGASLQVIIMASSLEFAKLVVASFLYQYWDTINKGLRAYLSIACFVLILITSGGIYGFLSGAYQSTANQSELLDRSLMMLNQKQVRFEEQKEDLKIEKQSLTKSISDLRVALSNPAQVQYIDKESGTLITTSSSSARKALQSELVTATTSRNNISIKMEAVLDSINTTDIALLDKEISNEAESELGPLKYLAEATGSDMSQVVNWFLLLIIFVFDPLAIALVVAANMAFDQINPAKRNSRLTQKQDKVQVFSPVKDLVVTDLESVHEGKQFQHGIDAILEVLEEEEFEEFEIPVSQVPSSEPRVDNDDRGTTTDIHTTEHELYHGNTTDDKLLSGNDKRRRKKDIIKRVRKPKLPGTGNSPHNPNPYRG